MSTVKIKTESTTATATAVDVKVKYEPSLSTADIKLEQHTSDIDAKVEFDSEADSETDEEDQIKSEDDDDDEDEDTDQFTITPKKQRQWICQHPGCDRGFNSSSNLSMHRSVHRLQAELNILGKTYILTRQSLNERWPCPIPDCVITYKAVHSLLNHMRVDHSSTVEHKQQNMQPSTWKTRPKHYFVGVDDFYVNRVRCGYHTTTGVFICYECRLVPECLLAHLQQQHGYTEKLFDNTALPENAVTAGTDPNINQHVSNSHLASAIRQPYQLHQDIVRGWLCGTTGCGYCGNTTQTKSYHKKKAHHGKRLGTIPVFVLRLVNTNSNSSYFFISRINQASGTVTTNGNRVNQHKLDYSHNGLNSQNENGDDASQNETTDASNQKRQWRCEYNACQCLFSSSKLLYMHRREHKLEVVINVRGMSFNLTRQSPDVRWICPVPDCESTCKTVTATWIHIQNVHITLMKQKRINCEGTDNQLQQPIAKRRPAQYYINVADFYVSDIRCGYHIATGVFICHECRLVPESLLTHLQQEHGYDEKSVDSANIPDIAGIASADPNGNQHSSNLYLKSVIHEPNQLQHPDIVRGWLCVTSNCFYCCSTKESIYTHLNKNHSDEQIPAAYALVLQLLYAKTQSSGYLITRLDTIITNNIEPNNCATQDNCEYIYEEDDGDELVLSDYGDQDDNY